MKNIFRIFTMILLLFTIYVPSIQVAYAGSDGYTGTVNNSITLEDDGAGGDEYQVGEYLYDIDELTIRQLTFKLSLTGTGQGEIYYEILNADTDAVLSSEYVMDNADVSVNATAYTHILNTPVAVNGNIRLVVRTTDNVDDANKISVWQYYGSNIRADDYFCQRKVDGGAWDGADDAGWGEAYFSYSYSDNPVPITGNATNVVYNYFYDAYDATLNFTLSDDGGDNQTVIYFYYQDASDNETWYFANSPETWASGQSGNVTVSGQFELGHTYNYFVRADNDYGYGDGNTEQFTVTQSEQSPNIRTLGYPINIDLIGLTAVIYGQVLDYGGSNVTGYFWYREYGSENFTLSSNTTDLQNNDTFSANITGLSLGTIYEFKAEGINAYGTSTGGLSSFSLIAITTPTIETLPATYIDNTSAYLCANVTDLGNDSLIEAYWQYRQVGTSTWQETPVYFISEIGEILRQIIGLNPATQYEFRAVALANVLGGSNYYDYGDTRIFTTFATESIPILRTDNVTWVSTGYVMLDTYIIYDGGSPVEVYSRYRVKGDTIWSETPHSYGAVTDDNVSQFASSLINNTNYQYQSVGINSIGTGYGSIREFYITTEDTTQDDTPDTTTDDISTWLDELMNSWGLEGVMGQWAMMFIIILLVSLVFGMAVVTTNGTTRIAISFAWILASASVLGAFLFSGRLGVFTIIVAVGVIVIGILVFASSKLSGSGREI